MASTEERVKQVIAKQLNVGISDVKEEARFIEDLGAESMQSLELIAAFEEEFDMSLDEDEAGKVRTVGQAVKFFEDLLEGKENCNTQMIMSYLGHIEMSAFKEAIIPDLIGGYYGRKGHNHGEPKGIKASACNSQDTG